MIGAGHNRWPNHCLFDAFKKMMRVKSGEEWWRVSSTLHRHKCLTHTSLHYECEEWRVFSKVAFYASGVCKWLKNSWLMGCRAVCPDKFNLSVLFSLPFNSMFSTSELIDFGAIKLWVGFVNIEIFRWKPLHICIFLRNFAAEYKKKKSYGRD